MMNRLALIEAHFGEFRALGVHRIGTFGSFARDDSGVDVSERFR